MRRCCVISYLYLSVLARNNEFTSHRAAREITLTWLVICRADLGVQKWGHTKRRATTGGPRGYGRPHSQNVTDRYPPCLQALLLFARAIVNIGDFYYCVRNKLKY